ncbi:MAG: AI-2E family transporter, partial [Pirellulales bacterium]|nr:AI-2E family transporter [Pirellulales bacterium]
MPRVISFIVLLAIILLVGAVFFQVMAQFIVPMFLACVLLVVFQPLHRWILHYLPSYPRVAALATTIAILLVVLLPLVWLGWKAYVEMHSMFAPSTGMAAVDVPPTPAPPVDSSAKGPDGEPKDVTGDKSRLAFIENLKQAAYDLRDNFHRWTGIWIDNTRIDQYGQSMGAFLTSKAISGLQSALGVLIGLAIMVIALYYFLADGPAMINTVLDLSPLDSRYEQELLERFGDVSRAVVVATLLSALVQGALAGIGYSFALPHGAPVFFLTALTMVTALVPFVGAAATWICVAGWVYLYG